MHKLFPFVGSKSYWVGKLPIDGRVIVEPFAGSAALSFNHASSAVWNDLDPLLYRVLSEFDRQIVTEKFTSEDYLRVRKQSDWWRYAFCLQRMSYSGVWRWSKNGYNVPVKTVKVRGLATEYPPIYPRKDYESTLKRWNDLTPTVTNLNYDEVTIPEGAVVIIDPPYQGSQASYNAAKFDYLKYWDWVYSVVDSNDCIIFDREYNIHDWLHAEPFGTRKMRVNGAREGDVEVVGVRFNGEWVHGG